MQKPLRELRLKRFWTTVKHSSSGSGNEQGLDSDSEDRKNHPNSSLPLLQVWPSSDSPRGEADGQSFVFPPCAEDATSQHSISFEIQPNDSGIESIQVSPLPPACTSNVSPLSSPTPSVRRPSCALLHPDHARLLRQYPVSEHASLEDVFEPANQVTNLMSESSTNSSLNSIHGAGSVPSPTIASSSRHADPVFDSRRRSSTMTARYSLFDALDLEYALLRAAARGSVGPYSLSESLHKLTFTQSLAFPALARGLAGKRRSLQTQNTRPLNPTDGGLNAFAKVVTALVLVLVSVLVFAVVYKFVRT